MAASGASKVTVLIPITGMPGNTPLAQALASLTDLRDFNLEGADGRLLSALSLRL